MFKTVTLVLVSLVVMASTATAGDDLMSELASSNGVNITDAAVEIDEVGFDFDVDELAKDADGEESDAIEACFRRFGYRSWGHGYGYGYRSCYRSYYNCYSCYSRPIYNYCAPVVRYWGCY